MTVTRDSRDVSRPVTPHVRVPVPVRVQGTTVPEEPRGRAARGTKKRWTGEKRALIADLAVVAKKRNQPPIPERLKDILLSHIGHLLSGGYALALVRDVALALVEQYDGLRGYSKLGQLHMRVKVRAAEIEREAHQERMRDAERAPLAPEALSVARAFIASHRPRSIGLGCSECGGSTHARCARCGVRVHPKVCAKRHVCQNASAVPPVPQGNGTNGPSQQRDRDAS